MANEYLKRTPTSTGNRKVWTWSGWVKINKDFGSSDYNTVWSVAAGVSGDNSDRFHLYHYSDGRWVTTGTSSFSQIFTGPGGSAAHSRDPSSWIHICLSIDTTTSSLTPDKIQRFWVNGIEYNYDDVGNIAANANLAINGLYEHHIGSRDTSGSPRRFDGQMTDLFLVDGQALTPDVFGFYKEGKGYISAGSTQSTDFRPGQWVPKAPRTIKSEINRKGGFGVNGFYLPMNDSSNFGADFHTTPNSIITLKGENLAQPRNGAPTTTDAYVSQLREDPYKDYLVYAVPGISTATGANLITNGTFDTNISGWTAQNAAISWDEGELHVDDSANAGTYSSANQTITTVIGKRYTMTVDIISTSGTPSIAVYSSGWSASSGDVFYSTYSSTGKKQVIFTATSTSSTISLQTSGTTLTVYDNVVVKQEDAPRDYSADIKGSGTNKTITAGGNAGIGYELGNYYGSAIDFDGSGFNDYIETPHSTDFNFGSGDFTVECWRYLDSFNVGGTYLAKYDGTIAGSDWYLSGQANGVESFYWYNGPANTLQSIQSSNNTASLSQWDHIAACRKGNQISLFVNGACVGTATTTISLNDNVEVVRSGADASGNYQMDGRLQDIRVYKGVAKYEGGFDVPKPYTPVGIGTWRAVPDTTANNFATLNPLHHGTSIAESDGNLSATWSGSGWQQVTGTVGVSTGKWYWESVQTSAGNQMSGIILTGIGTVTVHMGQTTDQSLGYYGGNGNIYYNSTDVAYGDTWTQNDIIGVAFNATDRQITFYKNGSSQGTVSGYTVGIRTEGTYAPAYATNNSGNASFNFGQNPTFSGNTTAGTFTDGNGKGLFKYQPPSGFLALCEDNLPTPAIADPGKHFKTVLYTGDGNNGRSITGLGFKPDLVWIKSRNATGYHQLMDSVRGAGIQLYSNSTLAEASGLFQTSFDEDGFSISWKNSGATNQDGRTYVAWCWKAGGPAVTNTDGTITSQVSANQTAGFSIVSYTATGSAATVGHGLGKNPGMIIIKSRDSADTWPVWHKSFSSATDDLLQLEKTIAVATISNYWNSSAPNTTTFGLAGGSYAHNLSGDRMIAYCWTEIEGFSKFGSYVGNGDPDGPFVYCGFKPAWLMVKRTNGTENWLIDNSSSSSTNPIDKWLFANEPNIEGGGIVHMDFLSNGFKHRFNGADTNSSGGTYIFAAFAESPFQSANAK